MYVCAVYTYLILLFKINSSTAMKVLQSIVLRLSRTGRRCKEKIEKGKKKRWTQKPLPLEPLEPNLADVKSLDPCYVS